MDLSGFKARRTFDLTVAPGVKIRSRHVCPGQQPGNSTEPDHWRYVGSADQLADGGRLPAEAAGTILEGREASPGHPRFIPVAARPDGRTGGQFAVVSRTADRLQMLRAPSRRMFLPMPDLSSSATGFAGEDQRGAVRLRLQLGSRCDGARPPGRDRAGAPPCTGCFLIRRAAGGCRAERARRADLRSRSAELPDLPSIRRPA